MADTIDNNLVPQGYPNVPCHTPPVNYELSVELIYCKVTGNSGLYTNVPSYFFACPLIFPISTLTLYPYILKSLNTKMPILHPLYPKLLFPSLPT
ncbi:hypothetical protein L873DRAFT_1466470 [Choiromyces venosus 120613-1]|uniref:Uncharacterized protein n=1 Tax=Choiromyces venosus 120613-1 TaxID=1336337 RepID=A0A3N4J7F6_9PEZI|nr:hypothetical protein L873DRAFT_1466470 [Choiromyces venosus 120613-1]